jgi:FKBP-type peptidyl-prolyl cis-trans isomerase 2
MVLQKRDFIEVAFTGRIKGGEIFDSNIKEDLQKLNSDADPFPAIFCLGEGMFLKGIDDFLLGKEIGKYTIELSPENAFGKRTSELVQTIPMKVFQGQNVRPHPGAVFNFDGKIAKILTVSGGRVIADFNNPLAGKDVVYEIKILRKIEDINEKTKAFINFFFRSDLPFSIQDKKIVIEVVKGISKYVEMFREKFKDLLGLELEVKEIESATKTQQ